MTVKANQFWFTLRPTLMRSLAAEAEQTASARGHFFSYWQLMPDRSSTQAYCVCLGCGKRIEINCKPLPNETELSGEALAVECPNRVPNLD